MSSGRKIILKSADGKRFEVDEEVAMQFHTIKLLFDIENRENEDEFPLPNVSGRILAKIIEYCKKHVDSAKEDCHAAVQELEVWDREFVNVSQSTLFKIMLAANYLNIASLMDLTCQTVAKMIEGKNREEIRCFFDIENDYTPEEEEELQKDVERPNEYKHTDLSIN